MSEIDVRAINLNLLPALEALLVEGSVSGAARRVHVSQSAMSHSLARLREVFGDPLLVTAGRRMILTPLAQRLASELSFALDRLGRALVVSEPFSPLSSRRTFRVATADYFEITTLRPLLEHLHEHAPGVRIEVERFSPALVPGLVAGDIDLALLDVSAQLPLAGLRRARLYDDPFSVIVRKDHPAVRKSLDLDTYVALGHVVVSVQGRREGVVDRALAEHGLSRSVALRVPHFASAPLAVASSDLICTIVTSIALWGRELLGLQVFAPPVMIPPAGVVAFWPRRHDEDAAARWFRDLFLSGQVFPPHLRALASARRPGTRAASAAGQPKPGRKMV